jgi:thiol-disulfide isomerase/thioredoxin
MVELDLVARLATAAILLWAALAKLSGRDSGRFAAYGLPVSLRAPSYYGLAVVEAAVAGALLAGATVGPPLAVGLGILFTGALVSVRLRGIRRLDCGCFGSKERPTDVLIARAVGFTALAGVGMADLQVGVPSGDALVVAALIVLAAVVVVLGLLVLALYRQVGILTLRLGPGVALELAEEGPPVAEPAPDLDGLAGDGAELVAFFSPGCRLCRQLAPAVRALAREGLHVRIVYEHEEPDAFERWRVPGTPFAVHVVAGTVAAKGTVNTLEQLEQLISVGFERVEHAPA